MNTPANHRPAPGRTALGRAAWAGALLLLAVAGTASLWFVLHAAWADAGSLGARNTVTGWREGTGPAMTTELWDRTQSQLQSALEVAPGNAQLHDDMGYIHAARSQSMGRPPIDSPEYLQQQNLMDQAISHYRVACALRPTFPYTWAYFALAKHYRGQHDDEFLAAYDHAMQYGHSEADLHLTLAEIAYSQWARLGPQRQQIFANMATTAKESSRLMFRVMAERAGVQLPKS